MMGRKGYPETSERYYCRTLRNIPEERRSQLLHSASINSSISLRRLRWVRDKMTLYRRSVVMRFDCGQIDMLLARRVTTDGTVTINTLFNVALGRIYYLTHWMATLSKLNRIICAPVSHVRSTPWQCNMADAVDVRNIIEVFTFCSSLYNKIIFLIQQCVLYSELHLKYF